MQDLATLRPAVITGTGMYVPDKVVKNKDFESMFDTSDEWIRQRSGIEERRFVEVGTPASELAYKAALKALEKAKIQPKDLDLVMVATLSPEHYFPGTSAFLQARLGLETTPAFDVRAQCSGFIYGLNLAKLFVASGQYNRVLLVGVELQSVALDMSTRGRDIAVLFGDGAGAVIVEAGSDKKFGILSCHLHAQGEHASKLWCEYPSTNNTPIVPKSMIESGVHPTMDGKFVFKNAVTRLPDVVNEGLKTTKMAVSDVDLFLFHQANLRINEFVGQQMGIPPEKTYNNIQKYGNTSAASIPILLDECVQSGKLKPGMTVCMAAFGAGFTWASAVVRWV